MLSQELVRTIQHDREREIEAALRAREQREAIAAARAAERCAEFSASVVVRQPRHATGAEA